MGAVMTKKMGAVMTKKWVDCSLKWDKNISNALTYSGIIIVKIIPFCEMWQEL
jgi:hypothetical protein